MALQIEIDKKLGDFHLNFSLHSDARRIGILGPSGCGKSLALKCIAGIENPDGGRIQLDDQILFDSGKKWNPKPQKRNVGYLFQNYALFPHMTVLENIMIGIKGTKKEKKEIADHYLHIFQLNGKEMLYPYQLSGGQQQRVALARILAYKPQAILLDEPFSALDIYLKDRLQHELMAMLDDYEGTVIMVSHNRDEIYRFCEDLLIMDHGKDIIEGKTKEIFKNPEYVEAARLTGCKNIVQAQRKDDYHLFVPDWKVTLELKKIIPKDIHYVGVRAHDFLPSWEKKEKNGIRIKAYHMDEVPFERKYYLETEGEGSSPISWFVQRDLWNLLNERGMPECLKVTEDKLLLLK